MSQPMVARDGEAGLGSDYIEGALGHAIVVTGVEVADEPAVAVWTTGPMGTASGAWVYDYTTVTADPALAAQVLRLATERVIVGWDTTESLELLRHLEKAAGAPTGEWEARMLPLPELLSEIRCHREALSEAVRDHASAAKAKLAPLEWQQPVPVAGTMTELAAHAELRKPVCASEIASSALHLLHLLRWVAGLWHETEEARLRRRYLDSFGPAAPLPPAWLAALRQA